MTPSRVLGAVAFGTYTFTLTATDPNTGVKLHPAGNDSPELSG